MKKLKFFAPVLGVVASAAVIAPVITSCSSAKQEKVLFDDIEATEKNHDHDKTAHVGEWAIDFNLHSGETVNAKEMSVSIIPLGTDFEEQVKGNNAHISYSQTNFVYDETNKKLTLYVDYLVAFGAIPTKETSKFDVYLEGTNWKQTFKGFTITLAKDAQ